MRLHGEWYVEDVSCDEAEGEYGWDDGWDVGFPGSWDDDFVDCGGYVDHDDCVDYDVDYGVGYVVGGTDFAGVYGVVEGVKMLDGSSDDVVHYDVGFHSKEQEYHR